MQEEYDAFTKMIFCELFGNQRKENVVISPYSILILMAIAAHATSGDTRDEIVHAILSKGSYEELEELASDLISRISAGDSICTSSAAIVRTDYVDSIKDTYAGQLKSIFDGELLVDEDLIRCTNDWVNEKTSGVMRKIMDESMKDALMCLVNAILFQDEWAAEYEEDDIKENEKFMNVDGSTSHVTMLVSHENDYVENQYFTGFVKPYKGGFSYMALLPAKEGDTFLLKALKDTSFNALYANRTPKEVYVHMPEFACEFEENLETACKKFGIKTLFKDSADFSNMSNAALKIKGIIHKAKIEVDRQGTRAATVTAGIAYAGSTPDFDNFREVILDRPFVYAIIHEETGRPIFVGTVNQLPDEKKTHLDADLFVHPSDKAAMAALKAIPGFSQAMKAFMKIWNEQQFKIINMSTNLRLSEQQMKKYYDVLPPICEKLGIDIPEIYVELDVNPNAYTYGDTHPFIVLTSGLFETLPDELIPSVIAHECGHIACHHTLYRTMGQMILDGASAFISGLGNIAIYPIQLAFTYWMRCSELSADRAAMIYEGNSDHVVETMMRFAGYDKDILAEANVDAFMDQAREYREMVNGNAWNKTLEFIMFKNYGHPLNAVRALEAHEWEQSDRFKIIKSYLDDPVGTRLPLKLNPKKYLRKNSDKVDGELFCMGFENVELIRSTETEDKAKVGDVIAISIDGDSDCDEDYYFDDAKIVLTFYEPKTEEEIAADHPTENKMIEDSKFYLGKDYNFVVNAFKELGFTNVEVKEMAIPKIGFFTKPDTAAKIIIDGADHFEKDSWYDPDVKITVYYYVKV
ncbi:MAG: M48 family metalloprotease [Clostridiales bacterium]|nr:M48 family metalloprotease [Clostridiales bacterium]